MNLGPELFSMLGSPARLLGRVPLVFRYITEGSAVLRRKPSEYALRRYGLTYRWRLRLLSDIGELEAMERLINEGSDEDVFAFRRLHLASGATTTVVGSLLASVCATMLSLDSLNEVNLTVRGLFTVSLMLALMAVYLSPIQQRALALPTDAESLRIWLWNGRRRVVETEADGTEINVRESSLSATMVLQAPFELLNISITMFLGALTAYLGLAMVQDVQFGTGPWPGNTALFIFFLVCTLFTLAMFGQSLGEKGKELLVCKDGSCHN